LTETRDVRALDGRVVKVVEVVEDRDFVAEREAFLDKMRADETSAAGHENLHRGTVSGREKSEQAKVMTRKSDARGQTC
jgi:hypothetical protein